MGAADGQDAGQDEAQESRYGRRSGEERLCAGRRGHVPAGDICLGRRKAETARRKTRARTEKGKKRKFLDNYCENLTAEGARRQAGRASSGRDREIYRTIQILSRRQKNNPCLIGEAGVGKTAIAEGIALRIAAGRGAGAA